MNGKASYTNRRKARYLKPRDLKSTLTLNFFLVLLKEMEMAMHLKHKLLS